PTAGCTKTRRPGMPSPGGSTSWPGTSTNSRRARSSPTGVTYWCARSFSARRSPGGADVDPARRRRLPPAGPETTPLMQQQVRPGPLRLVVLGGLERAVEVAVELGDAEHLLAQGDHGVAALAAGLVDQVVVDRVHDLAQVLQLFLRRLHAPRRGVV